MRPLAWLMLGVAAQSPALALDDPGRRIYHQGSGAQPIVARVANGTLARPGTEFPCAGCHGERGEGSVEAGVAVPALRAGSLHAFGGDALARAIRKGIGANGSALHALMPRYEIGEADLAGLIHYLEVVERDPVPGVTEREVAVAMLHPSRGALAAVAGRARIAVDAYFENINRSGGIFGRSLRLRAIEFDADTPDAALEAARAVAAKRNAFAVLAPLGEAAEPRVADFLASAGVPVIAPIGLVEEDRPARAGAVFHVHSSLADQARVLLESMNERGERPARIALVSAADRYARAAAKAVRQDAERAGHPVGTALEYPPGSFAAEAVVAALRGEQVDTVLFFGPGGELQSFLAAGRAQGWFPAVYALADLSGLHFAQRTFGAHSRLTLAISGVPGLEAIALAGAEVLVHGLKEAGRDATRARFVKALDAVWRLQTRSLGEISFGANRRAGKRGAALVRLDPASGKLLALGAWREPH